MVLFQLNWRNIIKGLKSLLALLTSIPINDNSIEYAAQYFYLIPIIGIIEGVIVSFLIWILHILMVEIIIISILYPIFHILVTGGIHFDGYADYSDVIGSHRTGEYAIKVLKDPKRGTFAVISITLNLLISSASIYLLLNSKSSIYFFILQLILIYIASAEAMYITAFFGIEEPYNGLGKRFVISAKVATNLLKNVILFLITCIPISILIYTEIYIVLLIMMSMIFVSIIIAIDAKRRLGFVNGDVMGFSYELIRAICMVLTSCI